MRITVSESTDFSGLRVVGWFEKDSATLYEQETRWDGQNQISLATGSQWRDEGLWRTARGRWVLHEWSGDRYDNYGFVSPEVAEEWLVKNEYSSEAIADAIGRDIDEERGPGQPAIGTHVKAVIPDDQVVVIDAIVQSGEVKSRSEAIRILVAEALAARG